MPAITLVILAALTVAPVWSQRAGRLRPPDNIACPRDHLTAYIGKASRYERGSERVSLAVDTDWDTEETVQIELVRGEDARTHFLIRGEPFGGRSLDEIEETPGKLKPGMRVVAWVCENGPQPVIDWRPPEKE